MPHLLIHSGYISGKVDFRSGFHIFISHIALAPVSDEASNSTFLGNKTSIEKALQKEAQNSSLGNLQKKKLNGDLEWDI